MKHQHQKQAVGQWKKLSLIEQLANIGSEVERTISWRNKNNSDYSQRAFDRALELIDLTIDDENNKLRLKEICRLREILVDYFLFDNQYKSSDKLWQNYFYAFNFAARTQKS